MLHEAVYEDGAARMRHRARIVVPAGGELVLAPGGLHLMLMKPRVALAVDEQVRLEFACGDALTPVTFGVRRDVP
jgi:copper(I)-binding protein